MKDKISTVINGIEEEYDVLFTTHDEKNNRDYVVYTDNKINEDGDANIYLGRYQDNEILPITEEEKEKLEKVVSIVQREVCNED
jgi:uncharacterized protein YrzB (UPF0473 family)